MARHIARERNEHGLRVFIDELKRVFGEFRDIRENVDSITADYAESMTQRLEEASGTLQVLVDQTSMSDYLRERDAEQLQRVYATLQVTLQATRQLRHAIINIQLSPTSENFAYSCAVIRTHGSPGRPSFVVEKEQIEFLRDMHFTWSSIARLLGVSNSTLSRKRASLEIRGETCSWSTMTDTQL